MTKPTAYDPSASYETIRKERDFLLSQCGRLKMEVEKLNQKLDETENQLAAEKRNTERVRVEVGELKGLIHG